jgi:serine/threonine protein phosphatase PrpC
MFADSHSSMLVAFQQHLTAEGWTVKDAGGYLMKRRSMSCPWTCVHGGTSGSLIALVEGKMLISANVGDSSALMACRGRTLHQSDLIQRSLWPEYGGIIEHPAEAEPIGNSKSGKGFSVNQTLLLTTDHSPESLREYCRLTTTHPCPQNHKSPQLSIVYDSPTPNKQRCPPVFQINSSGNPYVTGTGRYYKNVRREWASLVATPSRARFQDALAFTRSLGDFHLQCYGVSHVPDVHTLDLASVFLRSQEEPDLKSASDESSPKLSPEDVPKEMICCIVACSDGVWDNWDWSDVSNFVLDPQRIYQVSTSGSCDAIAQEFMTENMRRSVANFGNQADNATAVICYIFIEQP